MDWLPTASDQKRNVPTLCQRPFPPESEITNGCSVVWLLEFFPIFLRTDSVRRRAPTLSTWKAVFSAGTYWTLNVCNIYIDEIASFLWQWQNRTSERSRAWRSWPRGKPQRRQPGSSGLQTYVNFSRLAHIYFMTTRITSTQYTSSICQRLAFSCVVEVPVFLWTLLSGRALISHFQ